MEHDLSLSDLFQEFRDILDSLEGDGSLTSPGMQYDGPAPISDFDGSPLQRYLRR